MLIEIENLNDALLQNKSQTYKVVAIVNFIAKSFIIHPFANGNGRVFWILLDLLFWKNNLFPPFIFHKDTKENMIIEIFGYYMETKNENILVSKFLIYIAKIYSHYKF